MYLLSEAIFMLSRRGSKVSMGSPADFLNVNSQSEWFPDKLIHWYENLTASKPVWFGEYH